jgi:hypothetical protein
MGTSSFHDDTHDIRAVSSDRKCTDGDKTERLTPLLFDLSYGQSKLFHGKADWYTVKRIQLKQF